MQTVRLREQVQHTRLDPALITCILIIKLRGLMSHIHAERQSPRRLNLDQLQACVRTPSRPHVSDLLSSVPAQISRDVVTEKLSLSSARRLSRRHCDTRL